MKIEKISKLKDNQYKIYLSDEKIITYDDVILKYNLLFKKDIDQKLYNQIIDETYYYECYNKALKYALKKVRCINEMKKYLSTLNLSISDQDSIIKKLQDLNIINDLMYTKAYINDKLLLSKDGPYKIKKDLETNDIDQIIIDQELSKIDSNVFNDKLEKLILKKINSNHRYSNTQLVSKIMNDMINLGYDKELITDIINNNLNNDYDILIKEYQKQYHKLSKKYQGYELENRIRKNLYQKGFKYEDIKKEDLND